jgi:hypothetical protein
MMKQRKKLVSLNDHKQMMELMKRLYGDVKDDDKENSSSGMGGTSSASEMVVGSLEAKEPVFQERQ